MMAPTDDTHVSSSEGMNDRYGSRQTRKRSSRETRPRSAPASLTTGNALKSWALMSPASASIVVSGVTVTTDFDISSPTVTSRIPRIADRLPQPYLLRRWRRGRRTVTGVLPLGAVLLHRAVYSHHLLAHLFHVSLHLRLHLLVHLLHFGLHLLNHSHHPHDPVVAGAVMRLLRERRLDEAEDRQHGESADDSPHRLSSGHAARAAVRSSGSRIINTGMSACRNTASATEPKSSRPSPLRPCVVMAIRSALASRAPSRILATGSPRRTSVVARTPLSRSSRAIPARYSSASARCFSASSTWRVPSIAIAGTGTRTRNSTT